MIDKNAKKLKWRPIKSAPKDRLILLAEKRYDENHPWFVCQGRWIEVPHSNQVIDSWRKDEPLPKQLIPGWRVVYDGIMEHSNPKYGICYSYESRPYLMCDPKYWMPLPEGPIK